MDFINFALAMTAKSNIIFIMNPISGTAKKSNIPRLIEETLDSEKFNYTVLETQYAGHAAEIAKQAKNDGIDIVVAIGGDGTVNEVARSIVGSNTALGIIPCGSGNGLARHLMLPMDCKKSLEIINKCEIHDLDYGVINGNPFFCTCGMGFDAFISKKFAESGKRGLKTYLENVLKQGLKYKPETYEIEDMNGNTLTIDAFLISCANASQYGNNAYIAPHASMKDGLLDVTIMYPFDLIDAPQVLLEMMNKTIDNNLNTKTFQTKKLIVRRQEPGYIHYDGDPIMTDAKVEIELISKGIKILVNPDADKTKRQPNMFQSAFSEIAKDLTLMREDLTKQGRYLQELNKIFINKINNIGNKD